MPHGHHSPAPSSALSAYPSFYRLGCGREYEPTRFRHHSKGKRRSRRHVPEIGGAGTNGRSRNCRDGSIGYALTVRPAKKKNMMPKKPRPRNIFVEYLAMQSWIQGCNLPSTTSSFGTTEVGAPKPRAQILCRAHQRGPSEILRGSFLLVKTGEINVVQSRPL